MTREEASVAYKDDIVPNEYFYEVVDIPVDVIKLEIIFPEGYSAQIYPGVFFGEYEHFHNLELQRVQKGFQRTSRGAILTIDQPLVGFRYLVHWVPLSQKEVDIVLNRLYGI